jgi:hypothetical protein
LDLPVRGNIITSVSATDIVIDPQLSATIIAAGGREDEPERQPARDTSNSNRPFFRPE